jgi:hypothetical protein
MTGATYAYIVVSVLMGWLIVGIRQRRRRGTTAGDDTVNAEQLRVGNPTEWPAFAERRRSFLAVMPRLVNAMSVAFHRSFQEMDVQDFVIFFTGYRCAEDFLEILLLCGNAEGYAAQKLLRSMFEHVVHLKYLHENHDEIQPYFQYRHITQYKHASAAQRFWGKESVPEDTMKQLKADRDRLKDGYLNRECKQCGRREPGGAWTSIPLTDMAEKVGLGTFVPAAYYEPLLDAHPSVAGLAKRLDLSGWEGSGGVKWGARTDRELADRVLTTAHALLLIALDVQRESFGLSNEPFDLLPEDYHNAWLQQAGKGAPPADQAGLSTQAG